MSRPHHLRWLGRRPARPAGGHGKLARRAPRPARAPAQPPPAGRAAGRSISWHQPRSQLAASMSGTARTRSHRLSSKSTSAEGTSNQERPITLLRDGATR